MVARNARGSVGLNFGYELGRIAAGPVRWIDQERSLGVSVVAFGLVVCGGY